MSLHMTVYKEMKVKPNIPAISSLVKEPLVNTGYEMVDHSLDLDGMRKRNTAAPSRNRTPFQPVPITQMTKLVTFFTSSFLICFYGAILSIKVYAF
jgi:hypothetical protein